MEEEESKEEGIGGEEEIKLSGKEGEYYSILNVSQDASEDEIRGSYRRLSLIFHPDKHQTEKEKEAAIAQFQRITKAYEVLSDPTQRAIYDLYGEEGIQSKMQLGPVLTTPSEIKAEFERVQREKDEARLRAQLRPKGSVTTTIDASSLFDSYPPLQNSKYSLSPRKKKVGLAQLLELIPDVPQISIQQSVETSITKKDHMAFSGMIVTQNGVGFSDVSIGYKRDINNFSNAEITASLGNKPSVTLKAFSSYLPFGSFGTISTTIRSDRGEIKIGRSFLIGAPVSDLWVGYLNYKAGLEDPGALVVFTRRQRRSLTQFGFQIGDERNFLNFQGGYDVTNENRLKANILLSSSGVSVAVGGEKQISDHSKIGVSLEVGAPQGVLLKFRFTRVGQTFSFPILLSHDISFQVVAVGAFVPLALGFFTQHFILEPLKRRKKQEQIERLRRVHKKAMEEGRKSADNAVRLMTESVQRKKETEQSKNGLIIVSAYYGNLDVDESRRKGEEAAIIDVTIPLQSLVYNSKLYLTNKSKANLIGFCDPCIGEEKKLSIKYLFKNRMHAVIVNDLDSVALPLRAHALREES